MPGFTLAEKIVARASGREGVRAGDVVTCRLDLAMIHDSGGPRRVAPILERLGAGVWDPARVVLVNDHFAPGFDAESAAILHGSRRWAKANGIAAFYDMRGICHVVVPEHGHLRPGMFAIGGDSHSPTGGAFGCLMFGVGATDMACALATGDTWLRTPETMVVEIDGALPLGVCAKDVMLTLCRRLGMDGAGYRVVEYRGSAIEAMDMQERMTLCNMAAELGGLSGIVPADETTWRYLDRFGHPRPDDLARLRSDADAEIAEIVRLGPSEIGPQVAAPHSPENTSAVDTFAGVAFDVAYIGACTGAKLVDLQMAASVLKGRSVASSVRLLVAPASQRTIEMAAADGTLAILTAAGATLLPSGCGACAGYGAGVLAEGEVCLSSTARNFRGRMGDKTSAVYLGSPYTVAASAIVGTIADPREFLKG
ncbi:MAG: 3-isopropylmalate dehydratase large subunit [Bosea sp.]|uniref:3-isopropylmalate dehydratase large subunit n=1 Tax=Bosea sp. (in: a-proteobacteria) TaxID=1871050 RepID=UPI001AC77DE4|nr:3-isopropylmalate dehydratase large subunit [Bosea sp. (in: a-proteobacteria)]MBN9453918.1 3-isopropylmalate dehydratase large subunit [Bosea sp. (in: a-proteobacteria)]